MRTADGDDGPGQVVGTYRVLTPDAARRLGTWQPGITSFMARLHVPSTAAEGKYQLALWLPDAYPSLRENPLYAIQLANNDVWDKATGLNVLGKVTVAEETIGSVQEGDGFWAIEVDPFPEVP